MDEAKAAIDAVFGDTSVEPKATYGRMIELRDHAQVSIDALEEEHGFQEDEVDAEEAAEDGDGPADR